MSPFGNPHDPFLAPHPRSRARRFGLLIAAASAAIGIYELDPLARAAYAVQKGRLTAQREHLERLDPQQTAALDQLSHAFHLVAEVIKPSVVKIRSERSARVPDDDVHHGVPRLRDFPTSNVGSGVVFDDQGHILTGNHVVADADDIAVELPDGREFEARVVGVDPMTDIAVIRIRATGLVPARFGDSDVLEVGHLVLAVGSPFKLAQSVSHGIVSALGRNNVALNIDYQDFIQTDCPINPGNSGGPLVNTRGEVIGLNTAIATESGSFAGIAFAIPSNKLLKIARVLVTGRPVVRGFLGVEIETVNAQSASRLGLSDPRGVLVGRVLENGPAEHGGLRRDDVVLEVDASPVVSVEQLQELVAASAPGMKRRFTIQRGDDRRTLEITIGEQPRNFSTRGGINRLRELLELPGRSDGPALDPEPEAIDPLGIEVAAVSPRNLEAFGLEDAGLEAGLIVTSVRPDGIAASAGLEPGQALVSVGGVRVSSAEQLRAVLTPPSLLAGLRARVVSADGESTVTLKSQPPDAASSPPPPADDP